jgi:hypothetical protein
MNMIFLLVNAGYFKRSMEIYSESLKEGYLRLIYGPDRYNGVGKTRHSSELYILYGEPNVVKVVKIERWTWLEHLFRMQELDFCRKLTLLTPEDTRHVGLSQ